MRVRGHLLVHHKVHLSLRVASVLGLVLHELLRGDGAVYGHRPGSQLPSLDRPLVLQESQHFLDGLAHGQDVQTRSMSEIILSSLYI